MESKHNSILELDNGRLLQLKDINKDNMETEGQKLYGKFNPTGDPFVEEVKTKCAELHDLYAKMETTGRIGASVKTFAQMQLLSSQMMIVKDKFLPAGL